VTTADLAVERVLTRRLAELVPGSAVVGEEAVHHDPAVLERLQHDTAPRWIIDPIDGTTNFSEGNALFVVQVAYVRGGRTRASWIHDPVRDITLSAEEGAGTWSAGKRLRVADSTLPPRRMLGALYANPKRPGLTPIVAEFRKRQGGAYRRCVGQEYLSLVRGEIHYALFTRLLPWDHAPGVHLHQEAGGFGRLVDGARYRPALTKGYILLAPDEDCWEKLRTLFIAETPLHL
jgi:fructose-1,6-bisphosphatase/inositol monophosphatase family enzyme